MLRHKSKASFNNECIYVPFEMLMSVPVRLWASCTKRSLTSSRKRGGSAIPCASSAASRKLALGCASSERAFWSWTRTVNFSRVFLMHGELAILCKRHTHNYRLAVYSVCGHACPSHWSHTSPLHDRTKTANGSCSSENPPRNSGMRPGLTVRRSTSDSTLSRPTVASFFLSKQAKSRTVQIYH